jgi:hypothetical protein
VGGEDSPVRLVGLCGTCRHAEVIVSGKGSHFLFCARSRKEPQYARYPLLPVTRCPGHEAHPSEPETHGRD